MSITTGTTVGRTVSIARLTTVEAGRSDRAIIMITNLAGMVVDQAIVMITTALAIPSRPITVPGGSATFTAKGESQTNLPLLPR